MDGKGILRIRNGQNKEAPASLERAYQLDPEKPEIQYFLARVYHALKDNTNAITFLQYAIVNDFEPENDARELLASYALESDNDAAGTATVRSADQKTTRR